MKKTVTRAFFTAILIFCFTAVGHTSVDWQPGLTIKTSATPLDTATTIDGRWIFVLTKDSNVTIYDNEGNINQVIPVSKGVNQISINNTGEILTLANKRDNTVQQLDLTFVAVFSNTDAPTLGSPEAPVEIVVFSDFQCPYCSKVVSLLEYALEHNPDTVRIIFKQFPLPFHKFARPAAMASLAAHNQGKFWEMHDLLFQNNKELSTEKIEALAKEIGLDMKKFDFDTKNALLSQQIDMNVREGRMNGVSGTPSVFVNGRILKERSPHGLQQLIDQELARTKEAAK